MPERHKVVLGIGFALEKGGKYLLMLRQNTDFLDGFWSVPRGHVNAGEHVTQTVIREAQEELGIKVQESGIRFISFHHYRRSDGHDGLSMYFKLTEWQGEPTNCEPHACAALEWFALNELPPNVDPEFAEAYGNNLSTSQFMPGHRQPRIGSATP